MEKRLATKVLCTLMISSFIALVACGQALHKNNSQNNQNVQTSEGVSHDLQSETEEVELQDEHVQSGEWKLVWHDEFTDDELDETKWNAMDWASEKNGEAQYYSPENVYVNNEQLVIEARDRPYRGRDYTSGAINTENKFSFLHGKIEIRAKLPRGQGIFPAFWTLPETDAEQYLPEIDIVEMLGHKPDEIWSVVHWENEQGEQEKAFNSYRGIDYSRGFNTFGLEWDEKKLKWFINGEVVYETDEYIPEVEMFLYMNMAVGGNWPGMPDESTVFPQYLIVDYVRVYEGT